MYNIIILFLTIVISGVIFNSSYNIKESTLFNEFRSNKKFKISFYLIILYLMIVFVYLYWMAMMFILSFFNSFDLLLYYWPWENIGLPKTWHYNLWNPYLLSIVIYNILIITLIIFSLSFMTRNILTTQKSYMVLIFSLIMLSLVFGGSINNAFAYTANVNGEYFLFSFGGNEVLFDTSLLFPLYAPGQLIKAMLYNFHHYHGGNFETTKLWHWSTISDGVYFPEDKTNPLWHWNILYMLPVAEIFAFSLIGLKLK